MSIAVVDASAVVKLLRRTAAGEQVGAALRETSAVAPAHLDAEVMSALGRLVRAGDLPQEVVPPALRTLRRAPIVRVPLPPLLEEAWSLRANVTQRDALCVVLARRLDALLVTTDARLARAPSLDISVKVVDVSRQPMADTVMAGVRLGGGGSGGPPSSARAGLAARISDPPEVALDFDGG